MKSLSLKNQPWAFWGLSFYAVTTLLSMSLMSIGEGVFFLFFLIELGGPVSCIRLLRSQLLQPGPEFYFRLSVFLTFACALSLICSEIFPLSYGGRFSEVHFLKDMAKAWYLYLPLFISAALGKITVAQRIKVLRTWILAFTALSTFGLLQHYIGWPRYQAIPSHSVSDLGRFHVNFFLGHHLSAANIFIFPFFAVLDFLIRKENPLRTSKNFIIFAVIVGGLALFWTYARSLWVSLPLGLLCWGIWNLPKKWAATSILSLLVFIVLLSQSEPISKRFLDPIGVSTRKELWEANFEFFKNRPLTGVGWHHNLELSGIYFEKKYSSNSVFSGHAHNNFLEMLACTGLIGLTAWILWFCGVFKLLFGGLKRNLGSSFPRGLFCAWLVFHINGMTQVNFWESKVLHQIMWMVAWTLLWVGNENSH